MNLGQGRLYLHLDPIEFYIKARITPHFFPFLSKYSIYVIYIYIYIYIYFIYSIDYSSIDTTSTTATEGTYPQHFISSTLLTSEEWLGTTKGQVLSSISTSINVQSDNPPSSLQTTSQDVTNGGRPTSKDLGPTSRDLTSNIYRESASHTSKPTQGTTPLYQSEIKEAASVSAHSKLVLFLASIPSGILGLLFLGFCIKYLSEKFQWRLFRRGGGGRRRMRRRRSRERARIVRDAGMMQITSVVNEANLEGIELQEW